MPYPAQAEGETEKDFIAANRKPPPYHQPFLVLDVLFPSQLLLVDARTRLKRVERNTGLRYSRALSS